MIGPLKLRWISVIFFISSSFFLTNCFIEDDIDLNQACINNCATIQGRFTTENGSVSVGNLPLELQWENIGMLNGTTRKIATTTTDQNGFYSFVFEAKDHELTKGEFKVIFTINQQEFIKPIYQDFSFHNITTKDTTIIYNYHLAKPARIRLKVINPENFASAEVANLYTSFKLNNLDYDIQQVSSDVDLKMLESNEKLILVAGNQITYIRIFTKVNGVMTVKNDSIFTPINEILDYTVSIP